jgi:hypothetical protein
MFEKIIVAIISRILPDWTDAEAVRQFVLKILGYLADMAASTATTIDDAIVAAVGKFAESPEAWASLHKLILDLVTEYDGAVIPGENHPAVMALADDTKIDPVTIVAIITAVMELLKWWRGRK